MKKPKQSKGHMAKVMREVKSLNKAARARMRKSHSKHPL